MESKIADIILLERSKGKSVYIWGSGIAGRRLALRLAFLGVSVSGFITSREFPKSSVLELPSYHPYELIMSGHLSGSRSPGVVFIGSSFSDEISCEFHRTGLSSFLELCDIKASITSIYNDWYLRYREDRKKRLQLLNHDKIGELSFAFVIPIFLPELDQLRACAKSIASQIYPAAEVIFVIDGPHLEGGAIREAISCELQCPIILQLANHGGISAALNFGISKSSTDFICLVDQDDVIEPDTLVFYRHAACREPSAELIYCDEDKLRDNGVLSDPFFKSGFDPVLLTQQNFVCHLLCIRRSTFDAIGGFRSRWDCVQDHEWLLRFVQLRAEAVVIHIPEILYHWRASDTSTALSIDNKPQVALKRPRLIESHLSYHRTRTASPMTNGSSSPVNAYRVDKNITATTPVSIVITAPLDTQLLKRCLVSVFRGTQPHIQDCVVVCSLNQKAAVLSLFNAHVFDVPIRWIEVPNSFALEAQINLGVKHAENELVFVMPGDAYFSSASPHAIAHLVALVETFGLSAVNSKVLFDESGLILSFGDPADDAGLSKYFGFSNSYHVGYFGELHQNRLCKHLNLMGLMVRKSTYLRLGGLSEHTSGALAVAKLSKRLQSAGERIGQCHDSILICQREFHKNRKALIHDLSKLFPLSKLSDLYGSQANLHISFLRVYDNGERALTC